MRLEDAVLEGAVAGPAGTLPFSPIHTKECQELQCDQSLGNNKAHRDTSKGQEYHPLSSMATQINLGQQRRGLSTGHRTPQRPLLSTSQGEGTIKWQIRPQEGLTEGRSPCA